MPPNKDRKFLFDTNNFDLPDPVPEEEVYVEPPPVFTLDELGFACDDAFAKGREAGLEEARKLREQYLAEQVERIGQELKFLAGAENYRAAVYEREVLTLTETIFKALFPFFTETHGTDEVKSVISKVLANLSETSSIIIELPEDDAESIRTYFTGLADIDLSKITFKPVPQLTRGSCRLSWKDGGALRDHQIIADEILKTLSHSAPPQSPSPPTGPLANEDEKDETEEASQGE